MKSKEEIMSLARRVIDLEESIKQGTNVEKSKEEIEKIIYGLSVPEMYELNDIVLPYFKGKH